MSETQVPPLCPRCQHSLPGPETLACPNCGTLLYGRKLEQLAAEARWQEQYSIKKAVVLWGQCLQLLPPDSKQAALIQQEIERLRSLPEPATVEEEPGSIPPVRSETFVAGLWKTGLSMIVSVVFYRFIFTWPMAAGFVLLILIHELGHVVANRWYDQPISAPIFIPFLGAVINLRQPPPNARIEAICAIAGPVAGTLGALICLAWYLSTGFPFAIALAWFGFTINLFNLLPVPPLDGGRVAAAVSPWIWIAGLVGMGFLLFEDFQTGRNPSLLLIILLIALPRVIQTLKPKGRSGPYYAIGRVAPAVIGAAYLILLGALVGLRIFAGTKMPAGFF